MKGSIGEFRNQPLVPSHCRAKVPFWVAARSPITFDYAVANRCNILCWPFTKGFDEAALYKCRFDGGVAKSGNIFMPVLAMMRHTAVYENECDRSAAIAAVRYSLSQFGNLFLQIGDVDDGFPDSVPLEKIEKIYS